MKLDWPRIGNALRLWIATALALFIAGLAIAEALADEPNPSPPPATGQPAPPPAKSEQSNAAQQQFYVVPAAVLVRVGELVEAQQREIERLREKLNQGGCS